MQLVCELACDDCSSCFKSFQDVDAVEFFAGDACLSGAFREIGFRVVSVGCCAKVLL